MASRHAFRLSLIRGGQTSLTPRLASVCTRCEFSSSAKAEYPRRRPSARIVPVLPSGDPQEPRSHSPQPPPPTSPPKPTKLPTPEPPPTQSPDSYSLIRYQHKSLTTKVNKQTQYRLSSAATFFETSPRFMYSASSLKDHPFNEHIPEVVILGASNVGKSTFLNALVSRSGIARVSAKPGRTTVMNAFGVGPPPHIPKRLISKGTRPPNESLIVMDTPGYGFRSQKSWGNTIVKYLGSRKTLRGAVVLLSSEKKLLPDDRWLLEQLAIANTRTIVVLTKADKAKGGGDWAGNCTQRAEAVMQELKELGRWRKREEAWMPEIYVTAVGMMNATRLGNNAGLGGVRAAILEMAGFDVKDDVTKQDEAVSYTGKIVSFDDIQWKP